jgi:hydroxymethylpyrimidine/phosphomethylpyrimidine kinase
MGMRPVALTIAGSDSSGGAGIVADLKTFEALGVWGTVALTAVTAQNTCRVLAVHGLPASTVRAQIEAVATDLVVAAVKTGMLGSPAVVTSVAAALAEFDLPRPVVDPVLWATTGADLGGHAAATAIAELLVPAAANVTPNLVEAAALAGGGDISSRGDMEAVGRDLVGDGADAVLVTGGHAAWEQGAADCLVVRGRREAVWLDGRRLEHANSHGTGCVLSAAIAANLALGHDIEDACRRAKEVVAAAIAGGVGLGHGAGAVDPAVSAPRRHGLSARAW